jgi:hypothetical protein
MTKGASNIIAAVFVLLLLLLTVSVGVQIWRTVTYSPAPATCVNVILSGTHEPIVRTCP